MKEEGRAEDEPKPCRIFQLGYCFTMSSAVSLPNGAAPVKIALTELRSYLSHKGLFLVMAMIIGGT